VVGRRDLNPGSLAWLLGWLGGGGITLRVPPGFLAGLPGGLRAGILLVSGMVSGVDSAMVSLQGYR
jgi:hypothetical protein